MDDEKRLDEDALNTEIKESATFRGELRQFMSSTGGYIKGVSDKSDKLELKIEKHEVDPNAHGAGVKRDLDGKVMGYAAIGATILSCFGGVIGAFVHKMVTAGGK